MAWLIAMVVTARLLSSILLPDPKLVLIVPSFLSHDCTALDGQSMRVEAVRRLTALTPVGRSTLMAVARWHSDLCAC